MLQIYHRFWQVTWAEQWQYRANLLMYPLYWLISPIVYLAVWSSIANTKGSVNGLTAADFTVYYLTALIADQFTGEITRHIFTHKIQDGTLSGELLRPVHPLLTGTLVYDLAFKVLILLIFIPVWLLLFVILRPDYSMVTWGSVRLAAPAVILGYGISFLIGAIISCLAFWTTRVYSISEFSSAVWILFSGQFVPLTLMPPILQQIASVLPFQFSIYFPIQVILNQLSTEEIAWKFALGFFWLVVLYGVFRWVWKNGLKQYSAVGA